MTAQDEDGRRAGTGRGAGGPAPAVPATSPTVPRVPRAPRAPGTPGTPGTPPPADAPARPPLGGEGFPATLDAGPPPPALLASVALWLGSAVVALVAAALLWRDRAGVQAGLRESVVERDPAASAEVVAEAAGWAFTAGTGSLALVGVALAVLARPLRRGRGWARSGLGLAGLVGVVVAVAVQDLVRGTGRSPLDDPVRVALLSMVPLVVAAATAMWMPTARAWLRRARARRG